MISRVFGVLLKFSVMKTYFSRCSYAVWLPRDFHSCIFMCNLRCTFSIISSLVFPPPFSAAVLSSYMQTSQAESADLGSFFVFYILMNNPRSTFYSIVWDNTHRQSLPQCFSCSHSVASSFVSGRWCRFLSVSSTSQSSLCLWLACSVSAGFYSTIDAIQSAQAFIIYCTLQESRIWILLSKVPLAVRRNTAPGEVDS